MQFTSSLEFIRLISRQVALEEVELAKDSLSGKYKELHSSIVAAVVPIVFRYFSRGRNGNLWQEIRESVTLCQKIRKEENRVPM